MPRTTARLAVVLATLVVGAPIATRAGAQRVTSAQFVNAVVVPGNTPDLSTGTTFDRRLGFFSDLYYDPNRNEYWGLTDRGPGGVLPYETRVERFTLDVNRATGQISNSQVAQTIKFTAGGSPLNGLAPLGAHDAQAANMLAAFDFSQAP